jgi:NAD(P)-dependent dehydrogenase (short-subunit alcohol dehydrogenase family)
MEKRIAVTGSTKLAGAIIERFDARSLRVEQQINFDEFDVFINNAHVGFEQCYLLERAFNAWKDDSTKTIINISSRAGLPNLSKGYMYAAQKAALDHMADNLTYNSDKRCIITTINLGMLNDDLPSVEYYEVCDLIEYLLSMPHHLEIPRVFLQHAYNYQRVQKEKKSRYE